MLRTLTAILITIGVAAMVVASGCSESDDTIVMPRDGVAPCGSYVPGAVLVWFDDEASLVDIDIVVRSFDLVYKYVKRREIYVRADVVEGDALDVRDQVSASPLVNRVTVVHRSYPNNGDFLVTRFAVGVALDDARALIVSYSELTITGAYSWPAEVEFNVPIGDEDEWVARFLGEGIVVDSRKTPMPCP